ncbi:MAG: ankyrin repeat domain-containing protein [Rickettsiaceae bacterium]|nr:ankyrin repeat domain-containing protein [Rickettsiaceae bacterium]
MIANLEDIFLELICLENQEEIGKKLEELKLQYVCLEDEQDEECNTLLIFAARTDSQNIVLELIDCDPDFNIQNDHGSTALIEASKSKDLELVKILLRSIKENNNVNIIKDFQEKGAIDYLIENKLLNESALKDKENCTTQEILKILDLGTEPMEVDILNIADKYQPFSQEEYQILKMEDVIRSIIEGWDSGLFDYLNTNRYEFENIPNDKFYKDQIKSLIEKHRNEEYYKKFVTYYSDENHIIELYTPGKYLLSQKPDYIANIIDKNEEAKDAFSSILHYANPESKIFSYILDILDPYFDIDNKRKAAEAIDDEHPTKKLAIENPPQFYESGDNDIIPQKPFNPYLLYGPNKKQERCIYDYEEAPPAKKLATEDSIDCQWVAKNPYSHDLDFRNACNTLGDLLRMEMPDE